MTQTEKDINFKRPDFETGNIKPAENPYDIHAKGLKYDNLKKRNDELVEVLKRALPYLPTGNKPLQMGFIGQEAELIIKNNEND